MRESVDCQIVADQTVEKSLFPAAISQLKCHFSELHSSTSITPDGLALDRETKESFSFNFHSSEFFFCAVQQRYSRLKSSTSKWLIKFVWRAAQKINYQSRPKL